MTKQFPEGGDDRYVWLDVKKTWEELRPGRICRRAFAQVKALESQQSPVPAEMVMNGRFVKVGANVAGQVVKGTWQWKPFAKSRYSADDLDVAKCFAEDTE